MLIVKFQGGLGNQMFQYAFMKSLQNKYPDHEVVADISDYDRSFNAFHYGLEISRIFNVDIKKATYNDIERLSHFRPWRYGPLLYKIYNKFYKWDENYANCNCHTEFKDNNYKEFNIEKYPEAYFNGFWQNESFFDAVRLQIHSIFQFKEADYKALSKYVDQVQDCESVCIHVRRGDYVGTCFDCLPEDYYTKAINYIIEKVMEPKFFFFSDDIEYVKNKFSYLTNKKIVDCNRGSNSYRDMLLMSKCKHNIIANSSFSYWGAELNENKNKIVIAPSIFSKEKIDGYSLTNKDWIVLK